MWVDANHCNPEKIMKLINSLLYLFGIYSLAQARLTGESIVGGDNAIESQFPYQVSVQVLGSLHICGGGILNERFILTAAHCVIDKMTNEFYQFSYRIVVDSTDLNDRKQGQVIGVETIYALDSYKAPLRIGDIAVLKLKKNINLGDGVKTLKLSSTKGSYVGQIANIAGYGLNWVPVETDEKTGDREEGIGRTDDMLKYLNVTVVSNSECTRSYDNKRVNREILCAQAQQRHRNGQLEGVCTNDSGGPLVVDDVVIGILIASPIGCDESKKPALYTRVSTYIPFIKNVMNGFRTARMRIRDLNEKYL